MSEYPARRIARPAIHATRDALRAFRLATDPVLAALLHERVALFHDFAPAPAGGGHQFLRALVGELARRGIPVRNNRLPRGAEACLFNSFNFDIGRLHRAVRDGVRMVHRVDGPIALYRGFDDGTDARIAAINELAEVTVFQSRFSLEAHRALGFDLKHPVVIPNAADPAIFHRGPRRVPGSKLRLITSSWSSNPNKGAATAEWLDANLDWDRYDYTFVGRIEARLHRARVVDPVGSEQLAAILRDHDVFLAPSLNDPASNAVIEALACGLPVAYAASGGHGELVGEAGLPFSSTEDLPEVIDRLAGDYERFRSNIVVTSIAEVAERYLEVLGLTSVR